MRNLAPRSSMAEMQNVTQSFDRFLDNSFFINDFTLLIPWRTMDDWELSLDMTEGNNEYILTANVPGVKPDDIEVTVANNLLTIKAMVQADDTFLRRQYYVRERYGGAFMRTISLPEPVKENEIEATVHNGVLKVRLPKVNARRPFWRIPVHQRQQGEGIIEKVKKALPKTKLPKLMKSS